MLSHWAQISLPLFHTAQLVQILPFLANQNMFLFSIHLCNKNNAEYLLHVTYSSSL